MAAPKIYVQSQLMEPPTEPKHFVNKEYVDEAIEGIRWDSVLAATTGNLNATAEAGGLLVAIANGALPSIDGVPPAVGDRLLVWQQSDKSQNGLYEVLSLGDASSPWELRRTSDANASKEFRPSKRVYVMPDGATYGDVSFKQTTGATVILGSSPIEFALSVDTDKVRSETLTFEGDGSVTEWTLTHTLDTKNVVTQIFDAAGTRCEFDVRALSKSTIKVSSGVVLEEGEAFTVVAMGMPD